MKTLKVWYAAYAAAVMAIILSLGCKTAGVYDPVKSGQVVAALTVPVQETVTRVIRNSPQHSDEIGDYIRSVGNVFCKMEFTGQFSPEYLIAEVDKATQPFQAKADPLIITVKNTAVALYTIFYLQRNTAQLPPDKWPAHVAKLFCGAIDTGLKDAGKPGVDR